VLRLQVARQREGESYAPYMDTPRSGETMRAEISILIAALLAVSSPALAAADQGAEGALLGAHADGDQFERAMLEVIAAAAKAGKKITVNRMNMGTGEEGITIGPAPRRTPVTSVIAVEIRDPAAAEEPSQRILLKNQEEIIRALNTICEGQMESGEKLTGVTSLGVELDQTMRVLSDGVERVNEGVASTYSEIGDVSETSADSAMTLENIKSELSKLNQTVQSLLSSMDEVGAEMSALAYTTEESAGTEDQEDGAGEESPDTGESEESSGRRNEQCKAK